MSTTVKKRSLLGIGPAGAFEQKPTLTRVNAASKIGISLRQFWPSFEGVGCSKPYVLARMLPLVLLEDLRNCPRNLPKSTFHKGADTVGELVDIVF